MKKPIYRFLIACLTLLPFYSKAQTGFTDNFNSGTIGSGWDISPPGYAISQKNGELNVNTSKQVWEEFRFTFPTVLDISANPYITLKVKSNIDMYMVMVLVDKNDISTNTFGPPIRAKILGNKGYMDVTFDFGGKFKNDQGVKVDSTNIKAVRIVFNPAYPITGTINFDDLRIGSDAPRYARIEYPMVQDVPMGNTLHTVKLLGITNGAVITATSSNTTLLPNPTIGAVSGGKAILSYSPVAGQSGTAIITLSVSGTGYATLTLPFNINVNNNKAPTVDQVADQIASSGQSYTVKLDNIFDGNTEVDQTITITAVSSDQSVIPNSNISVDFGVKAKTNGIVTYTPSTFSTGSKTANITVTVMDNGGTANGGADTKTMTFKVTVYPQYYKSPTVNPIDDNLFAGIGVQQTEEITGITDGNGGTNIGTITASIVSGTGQAVTVTPVVNYIAGSNKATITYTASQLGNSKIVVKIPNTGAPANSNGNTFVTDTFSVRGIEVPIIGYIEDFSASDILGADYYTTQVISTKQWATDFNTYPQKWYIEGQGVEQTLTLDPANKKASLEVHKPNGIPKTFAGTWFSPRKLFDLSNNKYLSVKVSANPPTKVAFDIFDVNFKRYGQLIPQNVGGTAKTLTFVFNQSPADADLDFTKIATVLLNVSNTIDYNGTVTISDLKIGNLADNAPEAPIPVINLSATGNRSLFTNALEQKIDISNIYVVKEGVNDLVTPVTLTISSSNTALIPTPALTAIVNNKATLSFTPTAGQTGSAIITINASANGASPKTQKFTVDVMNKDASSAVNVVMNSTNSYQTIKGLGTTGFGNIDKAVGELGSSWLRFFVGVGQNTLEHENDNSDPNALDLSKFKWDQTTLNNVKRAKELGTTRFFLTIFSPPNWMKRNLYESAFTTASYCSYCSENDLDIEYYDEFAEWVLGFTLKFKEETGIDFYAVSMENEPEFDEFYGSATYYSDQLAKVAQLVGLRYKAAGLPTQVMFGEILPVQGHVLEFFQAVNNDPITKDLVGSFAIHNYDVDGIKVGNTGAKQWADYYAEAQRVDPKKELYMTETSNEQGTLDIYYSMNNIGAIYNALNYGNANGWDYLNLDSPRYAGTVQDFQATLFKTVKPEAKRIDAVSSDTSKILSLGFVNTVENTETVFLINRGTTETQVKVSAASGTSLPSKFYVYLAAEGIGSLLVDSVFNTSSYLTVMPPNSVMSLYSAKTKGPVTGIENEIVAQIAKLIVYPNPASEEVNIILPSSGNFKEIILTDLLGRVVKVKTLATDHKAVVNMDLQGLQPGFYFLSVDGDKHYTSKIILK